MPAGGFQLPVESLEPRTLLAFGDLDPTFGTGGKVVTDFFSKRHEALSVDIQDDGKIVVARYATEAASSRYNFAVARYLPDGTLDPDFGPGGTDGDGRVTLPLGTN